MSEVRLIDADKLKEELKKYFSDGTLDSVSAKLAFNMILRKIDEAQTVKTYCYFCGQTEHGKIEESSKSKWIPVSERLPDKEDYIQCNGLFIVSDGNRVYAEHFDIYDKKCFGEPTIYGFKADRLVIAWQPLPEPYKKGDTE